MTSSNARGLPTLEADHAVLLDPADRCCGGGMSKADPARELRGRRLPMLAEHPGGGRRSAAALLRALEPHGANVVYPGMLHAQSRVTLEFPEFRGGALQVRASVDSCKHLTHHLHEDRVRFDETLDFSRLLPTSTLLKAEADPSRAPKQLQGEVVMLGASPLESAMGGHFLQTTDICVHKTENTGQVLEQLTSLEIDRQAA